MLTSAKTQGDALMAPSGSAPDPREASGELPEGELDLTGALAQKLGIPQEQSAQLLEELERQAEETAPAGQTGGPE